MRLFLAVLAAILLSACAGPAVPQARSPEPETTTGGPVGAAISLDGKCLGPGGVTVAHPAHWAVNTGDVVAPCSRFAPEPFQVRPDSDARLAEIVLRIEDIAFEELAVPLPDEVARTDVRLDGRPAVRQVLVTGPGLYPEGTRITRYVIDLGHDVTLVADAVLPPGRADGEAVDDGEAVAVLDAMMGALEVGGRASR